MSELPELKASREFFARVGDAYLRIDNCGLVQHVTIEDLYRHFTGRLISDMRERMESAEMPRPFFCNVTSATKMSEQQSLASSAVEALAAVSTMDAGVTNEHAGRYQIRTLKSLAERSLADAFRHARELALVAEGLRNDTAVRKEQA